MARLIRGLIFDFDGLILDTEGPDYHSWREMYEAHGCKLPLDKWVGLIGTAEHGFDPYSELEFQLGRPLHRADIRARRRARYAELVAAEVVLPGVLEYIADARRMGLRLGIASSSSREWVAGHLERLGLMAHFHALACREDVPRTKPAPDLYLWVLRMLGIDAKDAITLEDSPNGVAAAKAAGLFCVAVHNDLTRDLAMENADLRLSSLAALPLDAMLSCISGRSGPVGADPTVPDRPRASAVVLRDGGQSVLMVRHRRRDGTEYWQLPGGGVHNGEKPEHTALRELREETGLEGRVVRFLFTIPYKYGVSTTFLVEVEASAEASLGSDPEEARADHRKLLDVAWLPLTEVRGNPEIEQLLCVL